jgi:hypothetical protein
MKWQHSESSAGGRVMTLRAYRAPRVVMTYHLSHSRVTPGQHPDGSDPHDGAVSQRIALLAAHSAGPSGGPKATGAVTAQPVTWRATRRSLEAMLTGAGLPQLPLPFRSSHCRSAVVSSPDCASRAAASPRRSAASLHLPQNYGAQHPVAVSWPKIQVVAASGWRRAATRAAAGSLRNQHDLEGCARAVRRPAPRPRAGRGAERAPSPPSPPRFYVAASMRRRAESILNNLPLDAVLGATFAGADFA